jgi:penicillin amidase
MQLDTRAGAYDFLRDIVLEVVADDDPEPALRETRTIIAAWNGHADAGEAGFRLLQLYYGALLEAVLAPLVAPAANIDPEFVYRWPLADEPLRRLLEAQPAAWLPIGYDDWGTYQRAVLLEVVSGLVDDPGRPPLAAEWGVVNRAAIAHPLAGIPVIGRWLRLDDDALPGSMVSLRVAAPNFGAVFRMNVSPGDLASGILEMPGGQSGHFLSANFADQHADWIAGRPSPFLAGATAERFRLRPATEPAIE